MASHSTHRARIASHTPGRLRVKIVGARQNAHALHRIKSGLEAAEGVRGVDVNPATGSVTMHYDPARRSTAGVLGLLEDADVIVESLTHAPSAANDGGAPLTVGEAIDDLNARGLTTCVYRLPVAWRL